MKYIIATLALALAITGCQTASKSVMPPQGGAAIDLGTQTWAFSGIRVKGMDYFKVNYPKAKKSKNFEIVNAGFILANAYNKRSQIMYNFDLNVKNLPKGKTYTRATLEDPNNPSKPIVYEHYLNQNNHTTHVGHGPLKNVVLNKIYHFKFELFADEARTKLIDKIEQDLVSPLDNTSGCVTIVDDYKKVYVKNIVDPNGKSIPMDKIIIACDR